MTNDADAGVLRIVIVTGDVMISGRIARRICVSLYRMHLLALYGFSRTLVKVFSQWLTGSLRPTMKMH